MKSLDLQVTFDKSHFIHNKYLKWYLRLIQFRAEASPDGYIEKHHVVPLSLGGKDDPENVVKLTAREHFVCHRMLARCTLGEAKRKMNYAISFFATRCGKHKRFLSSRQLEVTRTAASAARKGVAPSEKCRTAVSKAKKNVPLSATQRAKMSVSLRTEHRIFVFRDGEYFTDDDFYRFCQKHQMGRSAIQKKLLARDIAVVTAGKHKGTAISFCDLGIDRMKEEIALQLTQARSARTCAVKKQWEGATKNNPRKRTVVLLSPSGEKVQFSSMRSVEKHTGIPWTTIQSCRNIPHRFETGRGAGWTVLSRT